jgi:hypothetical protein
MKLGCENISALAGRVGVGDSRDQKGFRENLQIPHLINGGRFVEIPSCEIRVFALRDKGPYRPSYAVASHSAIFYWNPCNMMLLMIFVSLDKQVTDFGRGFIKRVMNTNTYNMPFNSALRNNTDA